MRASGRLALSRKALNVPIPMTRDTHQDFSKTRELTSDAYYVRLGLPRVRYELSGSQPALGPIMLTAISTVLGFIPIAPTVFWGPMAFAIMGGLFVATILTLIVLPTLYITWFRAGEPGI